MAASLSLLETKPPHPNKKHQDPNDKTSCSAADAGGVDILRAGMAACFKHAVEKGLSISIAPHLDDGLGLGGWRNGLVFDPLARYGSFSYAEFMLYPLADALNAAIGPNTKVSFALQGEMSATVFYYPKSYLTLVPYIKNRVLAGEGGSSLSVSLSRKRRRRRGARVASLREKGGGGESTERSSLFSHKKTRPPPSPPQKKRQASPRRGRATSRSAFRPTSTSSAAAFSRTWSTLPDTSTSSRTPLRK